MSQFRLRSSDLDRTIDLLRDGPSRHDGLQNLPGAQTVLATVRAMLRPGGGAERYASAESVATAPVVFRIRWAASLADLGARDRVRYPAGDGGRLYDIKDVVELGRRSALQIAAVLRVA